MTYYIYPKYTIRDVQDMSEKQLYKAMDHMIKCLESENGSFLPDSSTGSLLRFDNGACFDLHYLQWTVSLDMVFTRRRD